MLFNGVVARGYIEDVEKGKGGKVKKR